MVNKKYLLLAGLFSALGAQPAMAQESESATSASWSGRDMTYRGENYDVLDSSYYTGKKLEQFQRYQNHQTPFPPKPNNMWELGISVGSFNVIGDAPTKTVFNAGKKGLQNTTGASITVRKAIGYTFSIRGQFLFGRGTNFDYLPSYAQAGQYYSYRNLGSGQYKGIYFHNTRTQSAEFSLQLVAATNNIRFHKAKNSFSLYGFLGGGLNAYTVKTNNRDKNAKKTASGEDGQYDFAGAAAAILGAAGRDSNAANPDLGYFDVKNKKEINDYLKDFFDDKYDSKVRDRFDPIATFGAGAQFKLGKRVSLQIEDKITMLFTDYGDGIYRQSNGSLTPDKDLINYASIGLGFNLGSARKNVAPLWWVNPLDHMYSELSDPRHMRLPDPILSDDDNDGISNQFDKCPGTPAGVAVDSHGCPMDTDGDGVPDYKDKQMITPTECQPVDADGVGKCPCPDGCGGATGTACGSIMSGSLNFSGNSSRISPANQSQLSNLAAQMQANPTCRVVISGMGNASKVQQQRSWDRVNSVIEYMSEKHGIDRNRFIFQYGATGDENSVMYRSANSGEEGPNNVAPPFPNLRRD